MTHKFKYERVSDKDACDAFVHAILKLTPKHSLYRSANYIMEITKKETFLGVETNFALTDIKGTFKYVSVFESHGVSFVSADNGTVDYGKLKSLLRRMISAIPLTDYSK